MSAQNSTETTTASTLFVVKPLKLLPRATLARKANILKAQEVNRRKIEARREIAENNQRDHETFRRNLERGRLL